MAPRGTSFKTEGIKEFWIDGVEKAVVGKIEDVQFVEKESGDVETFIVIASTHKRYTVKIESIRMWSENVNQAA